MTDGLIACFCNRHRSSKGGTEACQQFLAAKGLFHKVVGACIQGCDFIDFVGFDREHDDWRQVLGGAYEPDDIEAIHIWKHGIDKDRIRPQRLDLLQADGRGWGLIEQVIRR
jgi:hypothetical protein